MNGLHEFIMQIRNKNKKNINELNKTNQKNKNESYMKFKTNK